MNENYVADMKSKYRFKGDNICIIMQILLLRDTMNFLMASKFANEKEIINLPKRRESIE